jgi:hypothetical protein
VPFGAPSESGKSSPLKTLAKIYTLGFENTGRDAMFDNHD